MAEYQHYVEGECAYCDRPITTDCCGANEGIWLHAAERVFCIGGEPFGATATPKRDDAGKLRFDPKPSDPVCVKCGVARHLIQHDEGCTA